jgi:NitT/TauT family transport system substrate-binding protein
MRRYFRRRARRALAAAALALLLGARDAVAGDPIRVAFVSTSLASIPQVVANAKGYFEDEGLDVTMVPFQSAQPIALAMIAGDVDFGSSGLTDAFFVLANQGALKLIGGDSTEHAGFHGVGFVVSNQAYAAGLTSFAAFASHTVGVTQLGSPFQYALARVLQKHGVDIKDVRIVGLQSNANVASAITGGQVDAAIMSSANLYAVVNRGGAKLLGWVDEEVGGGQVSGTYTTTKIASERSDTVRHFLAAFRRGAAAWDAAFVDAKGNRADQPTAGEMIDLMAKGLNQTPDIVRLGLNYVEPEARLNLADLQRMLDWYEAQGMQKVHIDGKTLVDLRYAKLTGTP